MAYTAVGPQDLERACLIWTKFQVPKDLEIEWDGLFLPLIRAPGHLGSGWARLRDSDIILLVTEWDRALDQREFIASPSAQLYYENLKSQGIVHMSSNETRSPLLQTFDALLKSYVQLFWVYFAVPVTETQKDEILKIKAIRGVAVLKNFTNDLEASRENHWPVKLWANNTESVDGQEAQLMLWPHFWKDAKRAEFQYIKRYTRSDDSTIIGRTLQEIFCEKLDKVGPMSWTEEFLSFKPITDV